MTNRKMWASIPAGSIVGFKDGTYGVTISGDEDNCDSSMFVEIGTGKLLSAAYMMVWNSQYTGEFIWHEELTKDLTKGESQ